MYIKDIAIEFPE